MCSTGRHQPSSVFQRALNVWRKLARGIASICYIHIDMVTWRPLPSASCYRATARRTGCLPRSGGALRLRLWRLVQRPVVAAPLRALLPTLGCGACCARAVRCCAAGRRANRTCWHQHWCVRQSRHQCCACTASTCTPRSARQPPAQPLWHRRPRRCSQGAAASIVMNV
jgi:hypothetical protein